MYSYQTPIIAEIIIKASAGLQHLSQKRHCEERYEMGILTAAWFHAATNEEGLRTRSWIFFLLFCTDGTVTECFQISYGM